jgi:hypothetical protein
MVFEKRKKEKKEKKRYLSKISFSVLLLIQPICQGLH